MKVTLKVVRAIVKKAQSGEELSQRERDVISEFASRRKQSWEGF